MKIRKNGFFVVQAFMVNDLGLKGNELLVYAILILKINRLFFY